MENISQMTRGQIWLRFYGWTLRIVSEHDNGEPKRKHKKKRIAKKWLKKYGTWSRPLDPGAVVAAVDGTHTMYMSRRTYCIIRQYVPRYSSIVGPYGHHGNATTKKNENLHL